MKKLLFSIVSFCSINRRAAVLYHDTASQVIQFVFTSDVHYGLTRKTFRGDEDVAAHIVNAAMIKQINTLPGLLLPADKGVRAGKKIGWIDYLIETGDIANRQENHYQSSAASWKQFTDDYFHALTIKNHKRKGTRLFLIPGNHDVSNAIGFYREMHPATDPTSLVGIYNAMMHPLFRKTNSGYRFDKDKVNYSKDISGVHFVFITIWPDSVTRIWLSNDIKKVNTSTPIILFAHDPPEGDYKHFTNPNGTHDINTHDKFENLLTEQFKSGSNTNPQSTVKEEKGLVAFLKAHPNIKAYFHGHINYSEMYTYKGPDNDIALASFRADSPMKGKYSAVDETKLSFQFVTIDTQTKTMTVRECLWNTDPKNPLKPVIWGSGKTVSLR